MEDLSKYLPLYLGQKVHESYNNRLATLVGIDTEDTQPVKVSFGHIHWSFKYDEVILILRPLSSMTEDEKLELYGFGFTCNSKGMQIKEPSKWQCFKPIQFQWLLSKGFDIFGLKEKGLALYPEDIKE